MSRASQMFTHSAEQLSTLFDQDHIKDGSSIQKLKQWGNIEGLAISLNTNTRTGRLQSEEHEKTRRFKYGDNQPIVKPSKTLWQMILDNFEDLMLRVLCASAIVSLTLGIATQGLAHGWMEGASILVAVIIIITVTAGNNYVKEKQFQKLNAVAERKNVNVVRNGVVHYISVYEILVGDIQEIQTGEIISVDGVLVASNNIIADESAMTGQPKEIKKGVPITYEENENINPFIVSGSRILEGTGKMLVLATGRFSQYGKLKLVLANQTDETPLQQKLAILAEQIGLVGGYSAGLTFLCLLGHIVYDAYATGDFMGNLLRMETLSLIVESFIIAISIIVVSVPQGLPLAVTISLAFSVGKMKEENNLVRYLAACQTMGGVDNICSDKTGTLTKNTMSVLRIFYGQKIIDNINPQCLDRATEQLLALGVSQNTSANPKITRNHEGVVKSHQIGNKTECALLQMIFKMGFEYSKYRNEDHQITVYPFSSKAKSMTTLVKKDGKLLAFTKGAPDFVLEHCTSFLNEKGEKVPIDQKYKQIIKQRLREFAQATLRTLLLAYREADDCHKDTAVQKVVNKLTIMCMVGIKDPIRQEIPSSVAKCYAAGVKVRMITGDNPDTAIAIAKQAGILQESYAQQEGDCVVMLGKDFRDFVGGLVNAGQSDEHVGNMENFKKVAKNLKVLARSSPTDKYLMATGLKAMDHVVAMTGDGTNDAPALKKADIGFAMGITGTEVAKEAAGIILLDDNFASIVTAMKWGRNIFDSIRKFLQFQLTVNFVALVMAFTGAAVLKQSPLNPIQMLWVNLIMDTLASLALATEPPSDELLKRKPYSRFEGLITAEMWKNIITQGLFQIAILGTILFKGPEIMGVPSSIGVEEWNEVNGKHLSFFFHTFVVLQIFNMINARKLKSSQINVFKNFFNNPLFLIIMFLTMVIQNLCIQYGGQSLKAVPLTWNQRFAATGFGIASIFAGFLFKLLIPTSLFKFLAPSKLDPRDGA